MLLFEHVENLGRPLRVGPIIKRDRDFVGAVAVARHTVRFGQRLKDFVGDQLGVGIDREVANAGSGLVFNAQDLALAFHIHILTWRHAAQFRL